MQQDKINMDDKLRQLENQQLPDLSHMDEHWQKMENDLKIEGVNTKPTLAKKVAQYIAAACFVGVILFFELNNNNDKSIGDVSVTENEILKQNNPIKNDTLPNNIIKNSIVNTNQNSTKIVSSVQSYVGQKKTYPITLNANYSKVIDSLLVVKKLEEEKPNISLKSFYDSLQKKPQEFIIDASRQTEIVGKEGSRFTIPPYAFVDNKNNPISGDIKIVLEEFYTYADIITANLTTESNGKQLVTGGMVKVSAKFNNEEVKLASYRNIDFTMPTKKFEPEMQIFYGAQKYTTDFNPEQQNNIVNRNINWTTTINSSSLINNDSIKFNAIAKIEIIEENPYKVKYNRKGESKAFFGISRKSNLSLEEWKEILENRYGKYYDNIVVKRMHRNNFFSVGFDNRNNHYNDDAIGDSIELNLRFINKWKLFNSRDSFYYTSQIINQNITLLKEGNRIGNYTSGFGIDYTNQLFRRKLYIPKESADSCFKPIVDSLNLIYKKIADSLMLIFQKQYETQIKYSFKINQLGWINCDRFYDYDDKINFYVNLPKDINAEKFVIQLVFKDIKSVMQGVYAQNKLTFFNIPKNMPVYIVGLGEAKGKTLSFVQAFKTGENNPIVTDVVETTPDLFKNKIQEVFNKL